MFELIITACLIGEPMSCRDTHLTYLGNVPTPHQCFQNGMPEMAKWKRTHSDWQITKFKCGRVDTAKREI